MADPISREFIQLLLSRTEIVDLIDGRVPLRKKSSSNYFACCPFHTEKTGSFSVSAPKQFYYCFGCGAHGNALDFLMQFDRLAFREAVEVLAKQAGLEIPSESRAEQRPAVSANLYDLLMNAAKFYQQQLKQAPSAIAYLKQRGLSGEITKEFGIGFAPTGWDTLSQTFGKTASLKQQLLDAGMLIKKDGGGFYDRFRGRILFPIQDRRGRVIGFGGRVLDQGEPKYLNSPETPIFQKGHELYGLYHVIKAHRQLPRALIVEGYMDVIALFQQGISYAVATLGTATTVNHVQRLLRYTSEIVYCFDGDNAGRTAAWRALLVTLPLLRDDIQVRFMFLPEGEDPDSLVRKEGQASFEQRVQNASSLSQFFFQSLATQIDLSTLAGRAHFVKVAREHLQEIPESTFRTLMLNEMEKRAQLYVGANQKNTVATKYASFSQKARTPSLLRTALTLLTQEPQLAALVEAPLPQIELRGFPLFCDVLALAKQYPDITTGGLLEHWREKEEGNILAKLAQTEHLAPDLADIVKEFLGAIDHLRKLGAKQVIDRLLAKAKQAGLSQEETQQLDELIRQKS